MIHRAICGSMERFIGMVIDTCRALPLWLSPMQVVVATITSDADAYAQEVAAPARRPVFGSRRPSQREDQLQSPRAFARENPGDARGRPGSGGTHGLDPQARHEGQEVAFPRCGAEGAIDEATPPDVKRVQGA